MNRVGRIFLLLALLAAAVTPSAASDVTFEVSALTVETKTGPLPFTVELATTGIQRARGLMHRESLAPNAGMLFDFGKVGRVTMWMKNTLIPLDMLFAGSDGAIVAIYPDTTPHSTTPIGPEQPVRAVLEVNGGTARRLGIAVGDRIVHPVFR